MRYEEPTLELYGSFRSLTRIGPNGTLDPASIFNNDSTDSNDGCNANSQPGSSAACIS